MKKTLLMIAMAIGIGAGWQAGAVALPYADFSVNGQIRFSDGNADGFRETVTFIATLAGHDGDVFAATPAGDGIVNNGDGVHLPALTLDVGNFTSGASYAFNPTLYDDAFIYADIAHNHIFSADLTVNAINVFPAGGGAGSINAGFQINLTDITPINYVAGTSDIIDTFMANNGAVAFTFQFQNINDLIEGTGIDTVTYSATAVSRQRVPDGGATISLLGLALLGMVAWRRRN